MNNKIIIPTADEIINIHKQVVLKVIDEIIEQIKNKLNNNPRHVLNILLLLDDEEAQLLSNALKFYKTKYE